MSARCSGACGTVVEVDGLAAPDGHDMPHYIMCRECANSALKKHGLAPLPEGAPAMLLPLSVPNFVLDDAPEQTTELAQLMEARAAIQGWRP